MDNTPSSPDKGQQSHTFSLASLPPFALFLLAVSVILVGILIFLFVFSPPVMEEKPSISWNDEYGVAIMMNFSHGNTTELFACAAGFAMSFAAKGKTVYNYALDGDGTRCVTYNLTETTFSQCKEEIEALGVPLIIINYGPNRITSKGRTIFVSGHGTYLKGCNATIFLPA